MKKILTEIQDGTFARQWIAEYDAGNANYEALKQADLDHPIEVVGKKLRANMKWLATAPAAAANRRLMLLRNRSQRGRLMNGARWLAQALVAEGVETLFGYPGGTIMPFYDALPGAPGLKHVLVRHEQGAAFAANGYARASGRVGVCVATSGPGASNLVTGIADAMLDSVPMVVITGQVADPPDGHRRVPGTRRVRHDPADRQAQLHRAARRRPAARWSPRHSASPAPAAPDRC